MTLSLYKITDEYLQACNELVSLEEELSPQIIADTIEGLQGDVEQKSINVAAYYKNLQKEVAAMKEYEKEMRTRRQYLENHGERLREYLKFNMERCEIQKIKGPEFTISIRKSPDSVIIDDANLLENVFIARIDVKADKTKIKEALKEGETVTGAHLETNTTLSIR